MADEMMALRALPEKGPDADVLREMIGFAVGRLVQRMLRDPGNHQPAAC
ncbi:hypothetical protein [Azospirillum formosense]|nr:hypothetical protein [Azospirillum formosense]MBY3757154.1 hypothetical protein [Azospirillum formosense]